MVVPLEPMVQLEKFKEVEEAVAVIQLS